MDAVLHYSRRSAESYLAGAEQAGVAAQALAVRQFCLSAQIAAPLTAAGAANVAVAPRPDEAALIVELDSLTLARLRRLRYVAAGGWGRIV